MFVVAAARLLLAAVDKQPRRPAVTVSYALFVGVSVKTISHGHVLILSFYIVTYMVSAGLHSLEKNYTLLYFLSQSQLSVHARVSLTHYQLLMQGERTHH